MLFFRIFITIMKIRDFFKQYWAKQMLSEIAFFWINALIKAFDDMDLSPVHL